MSVYRDKKEWNKWNEMVLASEHAKEDFNDFADDRAIIRADKKIQSLLSKNYALERQLAEAREFIKIVGHHIDGYMLNNNSLHAMSRIMKHYDELKEQGDE